MYKRLSTALFILFAANAWPGEQFTIPAGEWEMTVSSTNPFMNTPMTRTRTECRQDSTFDPSELIKDAKDCRITEQETSSSKIRFSLHCSTAGGEMHGSGQYEINGDRAIGHMEMNMQLQGQNMKMIMDMQGKRLGDC